MSTRTVTDGSGDTGTRRHGDAGIRIPREEALAVAKDVLAMIGPHVERVEIAGSLRRQRETVGDIDIVAIPKPGGAVKIGAALRDLHCGAANDFRAGDKLQSAVVGHGRYGLCGPGGRQEREVQVDIYFATPENFGMLMVVRTGSAQHNVWMAKLAQRLNRKFAAGSGVLDRDGNVLGSRTEEEVFGAFRLTVPAPDMREIVAGHPKWT